MCTVNHTVNETQVVNMLGIASYVYRRLATIISLKEIKTGGFIESQYRFEVEWRRGIEIPYSLHIRYSKLTHAIQKVKMQKKIRFD